jgi:chaperonin GroES
MEMTEAVAAAPPISGHWPLFECPDCKAETPMQYSIRTDEYTCFECGLVASPNEFRTDVARGYDADVAFEEWLANLRPEEREKRLNELRTLYPEGTPDLERARAATAAPSSDVSSFDVAAKRSLTIPPPEYQFRSMIPEGYVPSRPCPFASPGMIDTLPVSEQIADILTDWEANEDGIERAAFRPLHNEVLIRPAPPDEKIGSIVIPETAREKPIRGTVLAVGAGRKYRTLKDGITRVPIANPQPLDLKPGDEVLYPKARVREWREYHIVPEEHIVAVLG